MPMNGAILATLGGVVVTALVTYIVAARRMSGKIATSDASDLWAESRSMREDYRDRLDAAAKRTADVEARMARLEAENNGLIRENAELRAKIDAQDVLINSLRETIDALRGDQG